MHYPISSENLRKLSIKYCFWRSNACFSTVSISGKVEAENLFCFIYKYITYKYEKRESISDGRFSDLGDLLI